VPSPGRAPQAQGLLVTADMAYSFNNYVNSEQ
jgi:hypothetical protein